MYQDCRPTAAEPDSSSRYLIHTPFFSDEKEDHQAKWKQMEEVQAQGLTKSIGVSNYTVERLEWIFETAKVVPAVNQIEFNPYLQHPKLLELHKAKVGRWKLESGCEK